jgi:hypothetical protein
VLAPFPVTLTLLTEPILASHVARTPLDAKAAAPPLALQFCRLLI